MGRLTPAALLVLACCCHVQEALLLQARLAHREKHYAMLESSHAHLMQEKVGAWG